MPPQEGGIDYKKQYELLQIANLVLSDQITLLQYHTKMIKDSLDVKYSILFICIKKQKTDGGAGGASGGQDVQPTKKIHQLGQSH